MKIIKLSPKEQEVVGELITDKLTRLAMRGGDEKEKISILQSLFAKVTGNDPWRGKRFR